MTTTPIPDTRTQDTSTQDNGTPDTGTPGHRHPDTCRDTGSDRSRDPRRHPRARDALSVRRVFGDPYTVDGTTIIPAARIAGGGGGGGGEGTGPDDEGGHGFGTGFALRARPVGAYQIVDGEITWKPAIDADRLARGAQFLAGLTVACVTLVVLRKHRRR